MTYTHYADMFITLTLGWIRGVTNWIWSMIRLGQGSAGRSFLAWFSNHWVKLVIVLMLACVAMDWLIWLVRWRPYWLWFGKKRRLVNDTPDEPPRPEKNRKTDEEPVRRAAAPQFHSQALPRRSRQTEIPDDLFDIPAKKPKPTGDDLFDFSPAPRAPAGKPSAAKARTAPVDLFAVAPSAAAQTGADASVKQPNRPRSDSNDAIDWFE